MPSALIFSGKEVFSQNLNRSPRIRAPPFLQDRGAGAGLPASKSRPAPCTHHSSSIGKNPYSLERKSPGIRTQKQIASAGGLPRRGAPICLGWKICWNPCAEEKFRGRR